MNSCTVVVLVMLIVARKLDGIFHAAGADVPVAGEREKHMDFDKRIELDMQYIDQWPLPLDMLTLLKTVPAALKGRGAA